MASIESADVRRLLSKYTFKVEEEAAAENLCCTLCGRLMIEAYQTYCGCSYCRECILTYLRNGGEFCRGGKEMCLEELLVLDGNVMVSAMLDQRISELRVYCPKQSCLYVVPLSEMDDHLRLCSKQNTKCPYTTFGCESTEGPEERLLGHLQNDALIHSRLLIEYIDHLTNEVNILKTRFEKSQTEILQSRKESRVRYSRICSLDSQGTNNQVDKFLELERSVFEERERVRSVVNEIRMSVSRVWKENEKCHSILDGLRRFCLSTNPDFIWRIGDLSRTMETVTEGLFSPTFYSHNYKFCLYIYMNGDNIGLCCHLMKGDHDNRVSWPLKRTVTLRLLDQCRMSAHTVQTFHYQKHHERKTAFDRPKKDINNLSIGSQSFIKYSAIRYNQSVVVEDSIVLSCVLGDLP